MRFYLCLLALITVSSLACAATTTPADLPGAPQIQMPQKITIPLTLGLAQSLHMDPTSYPANQFGAGTEALIGNLTVEGNNVSFNGQPLSGAQQQNLAVLCMKSGH
jgi:hypothetical protein